MKVILELNNVSKSPVGISLLESVMKKTIKEVGFDFLKDASVRVSVALVSPEKMREVNRIYRKHNQVTDVLSFAEYGNLSELKKARSEEIFLGEILLCYDDIKRYSESERMDVKKEFARVFSHGTLHLLGLRHGGEMFSIQTKIGEQV